MGAGVALLTLVLILSFAPHAMAHPVPFSYVDVRIEPGAIELTLVAHVFDIAHELGVDPPDRLLEPVRPGLARRRDRCAAPRAACKSPPTAACSPTASGPRPRLCRTGNPFGCTRVIRQAARPDR